jgi:glycine oxidase
MVIAVSSSIGSPGIGPRVAIIGGGVIGLSIGWRLLQAGLTVSIYERGEAGKGASWAAAGMLAAGSEVEPGEAALLPLLRRSQAMWPDFAAELAAASGVDVQLRDEGTLSVALTQDDAGRLRQTYALQRRLGVGAQWLGRDEALELEPSLNPRLAGAVLVAGDHQVDNRKVVQALRIAFLHAGGRLNEQGGPASVLIEAERVAGVVVEGAPFRADVVIVAAGAWSPDVPGLPACARPPVRPVKGQMLALGMDPAAPILRHVLWTQKAYLTPRRDGRLIIGATTEERGFDAALTAGGMLSLLESAWRALPGIEELPILESWVGFRPGSRDDAPILGRTPIDGLIIATGHHRNGILLTPVTAAAIADLVLTGRIDPVIAGFGPERFGAPAAGRSLVREGIESWISA